MSVIITTIRPNNRWSYNVRWPVVGSVPDNWRSRIRYTLECGHARVA